MLSTRMAIWTAPLTPSRLSNGKPYLEINDADHTDYKEVTLTSNTKFLVHNMDGTYSAYTGYKNVPSLIAHYAEVVFDSDHAERAGC